MIKKLLFLLLMLFGVSQTGLAQTDTLRTWPYVCQADSFPVTLSGWHGMGSNRLDSITHTYRNDSLLLKYYFTQLVGPAIPTPFRVTVKFPLPQSGIYTIYAKRFLNNGTLYSPSTTHINVCMGINGYPKSEDQSLEIYPNPTNGCLVLKTLGQNGDLTLTDATGKILIRRKITDFESQFDLRKYPAGIYLLTLETEKGKMVRKIIKN